MAKRKVLSCATKEDMVKMAKFGLLASDIAQVLDLNTGHTDGRIILKHCEMGTVQNVKYCCLAMEDYRAFWQEDKNHLNV